MTGVIFLNMGGPDSLEAVRPFLFNLFSDRDIIPLGPAFLQKPIAWIIARKRAAKSRGAYEKTGGRSPQADITMRQAKAVHSILEKEGQRVVCYPGMRYWKPRTPEVLKRMKEKGVTRVLGLSMYPHYSRATTGSSVKEFLASASDLGMDAEIIDAYPDHPGYINALASTVKEGLWRIGVEKGLSDEEKLAFSPDFALVYSAHSLPVSMIEDGDPYVDHVKRTITALEAVTGIPGRLCFQSRSGPVRWLEPATDEMLRELAGEGFRTILVLPVSFVSDHVETLYEIDMEYRQMMDEMGVSLFRTPALNVRPDFVSFLADIVRESGFFND
jgi:ferrochelatase